MYDILVSRMFFRWLEKYGPHITGWTGSIAQIDALASLGTYAFNNPDNVYAEILDEASGTIIDATDIVHSFRYLCSQACVPRTISPRTFPIFRQSC